MDYSLDGGTPESSERGLTPGTADCLSTWLIATNQTVTRVSLGGRELNERNQSAPHAVEGAAKVRIQTSWLREVTHDYCMPRAEYQKSFLHDAPVE